MSDMRTIAELKQSYVEKSNYLSDVFGEPVRPYDFYRDLFPKGCLQLRYKAGGAPEDGGLIGYVTVLHQRKKKPYPKDHELTDELRALVMNRDTVSYCSPCSYVGGGRSKLHLRRVHALVVDLDYVDLNELEGAIYDANTKYTPIPTYIVNSGTGLHLYYVFEQSLDVSQSTAKGLEKLKDAYTGLVWNMHTSKRAEKQYEPLVQNYRVVGGRSKLDTEDCKDRRVVSHDYTVQAWKWGGKYTLEQLLWWQPNTTALTGDWKPRIKEARRLLDKTDPDHLTLEKAKVLYPKWYDERINRGIPKKELMSWKINRGAYEWWKNKVREQAVVGGRYHALRYLAAYALKAGVDKETLYRDAYELLPVLDAKGKDENERFTREDVDAALKSYYMPYMVCVSVEHIEAVSKIPIPERHKKHNGQSRAANLEEARAIRDIRQKRKGTNWWDNGNRDGAPTKEQLIKDYAAEHPGANHSQIAKALGVSRPTVIKWLKNKEE